MLEKSGGSNVTHDSLVEVGCFYLRREINEMMHYGLYYLVCDLLGY